MNIKFGTDNFYVRYLKRFLNHELQQSNAVLGEFNRNDLQALIKYLNLPNVEDMFTVQTKIYQEFPTLKSSFFTTLQDNQITFTSKEISTDISDFLSDNIEDIKTFCESLGWEIDSMQEWVDIYKDLNNDGVIDYKDRDILEKIIHGGYANYDELTLAKADIDLDGSVTNNDLTLLNNYIDTGRLTLVIKQCDRKNYFPNKDMLVFINQFTGMFLYNYAIRDDIGIDDLPHTDSQSLYKIALYQCTPGQKITIAHNGDKTTRLVIGSSPATLKQNIPSFILQNVVDIELKPGEGYQYTCSSRAEGTGYDAHWVCIQCPSDYVNLSGTTTTKIPLDVGDINFDGKIDMEDYHLLASYTAKGPGSDEMHWTPTAKQLAVMNVDETHSGIDVYDATKLYKFIMGDKDIPSLGVTFYEYTSGELENLENISNLLIIDGHYDDSVNIPFEDFITDDWIIHEKFFNYLLNMSIHKYSNSEDITYLQKLLKAYYPDYAKDTNFFYPGIYNDKMKKLMLEYQKSKISYTYGDLNRDNRLSKEDLVMLRNYLDDNDVIAYNLILKYLRKEIELTPEQIKELDINGSGNITKIDADLYEAIIATKYSKIFRSRADVNQDGVIDETDYKILEANINGTDDSLKRYNTSFILGWCDVETESDLELYYNIGGSISEVSK